MELSNNGNNDNYINTTNNDNENYSALYLNTNESQGKDVLKSTLKSQKQPSQSCNTSEKVKKNQKDYKPDKMRPFKRNDQNVKPVQQKALEINMSKLNNSLKIEHEVEVSITSTKGNKKKCEFKLVSHSRVPDDNQSINQNTLKNSMKESGIDILYYI